MLRIAPIDLIRHPRPARWLVAVALIAGAAAPPAGAASAGLPKAASSPAFPGEATSSLSVKPTVIALDDGPEALVGLPPASGIRWTRWTMRSAAGVGCLQKQPGTCHQKATIALSRPAHEHGAFVFTRLEYRPAGAKPVTATLQYGQGSSPSQPWGW